MTPIRLLALVAIFFATTVAWFILGGSINFRTSEKSTVLGARVEDSWGGAHVQFHPKLYHWEAILDTLTETTTNSQGQSTQLSKTVRRKAQKYFDVSGSEILTALDVEYRPKGLLWYSVFKVAFNATYGIQNPVSYATDLYVQFDFPSRNALFDDFAFTVDGQTVDESDITYQQPAEGSSWNAPNSMVVRMRAAPNEEKTINIRYRSQGTGNWQYTFGEATRRVKNFSLTAETAFKDYDIPESCLSAVHKQETDRGWKLSWTYSDVISNVRIGIDMPRKLNPGPVAERISFFAPVSLLFFFTILIILSAIQARRIHPMNYFFLAAAFFAFHLFFAYLVDHLALEWSFLTASLTSVFLVATYMRLVTDWSFTLRYVAPAQVIYLVLFSYSFFFEGYTGLTITIGAIVTLFVLMQITGRIDWNEVWLKKSR